jgi:meiotically up-regulated gene 157 (Mug157) protein
VRNGYTFRRNSWTGTETLNLEGIGNPLANGTGLIRSAFRPSDDATIFGFLIPANAMMSVELARTAALLKSVAMGKIRNNGRLLNLADMLTSRSESIKKGIYDHAVVPHKTFGDVFAFEIDGYGSYLLMDDANIPSLLSLPLLGFVDQTDSIYQNTRRMVLSQPHNPYYLRGEEFQGIGGPHVGLRNAWPMSLLVQAMTSDDEREIMECINAVKNVSLMGLINESVDVRLGASTITRSWFAWANSVFAQTILHLAEKKPALIFNDNTPYKVGE